MVAAKVCLLLCATGAQMYGMTPPNARPDAKERLKPTGLELTMPWIHILVKVLSSASSRVSCTLLSVLSSRALFAVALWQKLALH
jgi:hypothetical protein